MLATNFPDKMSNWQTVLDSSFPTSGDTSADQPTLTDLAEFPLDSPVVDMRYVSFWIQSWHGYQGGLQYFDIVRKPKLEKSGKFSSEVLIHPTEKYIPGYFYIKSMSEEVIKMSTVNNKTTVEEAKNCRWYDPGKYFQWSGDMLVNDMGKYLTVYKKILKGGLSTNLLPCVKYTLIITLFQ